MVKTAIIYTSATLNGSIFLVALDCALWLNKAHAYKNIKIITGETSKAFNPFSIILKLKNLPVYFSQGKLFNFLTPKFLSSKNTSQVRQHASELSQFCRGEIDLLELHICGVDVEFCRIEPDKSNNPAVTIFKRVKPVIKNFFTFFRMRYLLDGSYLNFKVDGIYSALHVVSEALRSDYKSNGSILDARMGILSALYKVEITRDIFKKIPLTLNDNDYALNPDLEYTYGFFSRVLCRRGAQMIEFDDMQTPFVLRSPLEKFFERLKIMPLGCLTDAENDDAVICDYLEKRIVSPWEYLDAHNYVKNKQELSLTEKIYNSEGLNVIVYLHSFTDAQFIYGYDGYQDLFDWAFETIKVLLQNPEISNVYVKSHPAINPCYHPGDVLANKKLKRLFKGQPKFNWVETHFGTNMLKYFGNCVCITHHGSVAEEAIFQGFPVIASTFSPWGEQYKFGYFWSDREAYENLLGSLTDDGLQVLDTHRSELLRYIRDKGDHTIALASSMNNRSWADFLTYNKIEEDDEFGTNMESIKIILSDLDYKAAPFTTYIAARSAKIDTLVDNSKAIAEI